MTTPDPQIVKYAPNTAALATALVEGDGADFITVLAAIGRIELKVAMVFEWIAGTRTKAALVAGHAQVAASLDAWLNDIETSMSGDDTPA